MSDSTEAGSWFTLLAIARALQFAGCLALLAFWTFDRVTAAPTIARLEIDQRRRWRAVLGWGSFLALATILLSGVAWFVLIAQDMSGLPIGQAIQSNNLQLVWRQTQFGSLWEWRLIVWAGASLCAAATFVMRAGKLHKACAWGALGISAALTGTLAWAGHGRSSPVHLAIDIGHLLVAGVWPAGLLPMAIALGMLRSSRPALPDRDALLSVQIPASLAGLVNRFSAISVLSVALLAFTGTVNSLLTLNSVFDLFHTPYGIALLTKMTLFLIMVYLGAINLLVLGPQIASSQNSPARGPHALNRLRKNVIIELFAACAVLLATGILGILSP